MRIKSMNLEHFQGVKSFEMHPEGKNVDISGQNGTGKTTVNNAYNWLLFNKPGTDEKNYSPETVGSKGLDHSAEIVLTDDSGKEIKLKKALHKSGKSSKTEYQIDDEKVKQKDYESFLKDICQLDRMRMIAREDTFLSETPKEERRKIIIEKAGDIEDEDVIASDEKLKQLPEILCGKSVDSYKKIAKDKIKDLKKESDRLGILIDAGSKELKEPEKSKEFVEGVIKKLKETKKEIEYKKAPGMEQEELQRKIVELLGEKELAKCDYNKKLASLEETKNKQISSIREKISKLRNEMYILQADMHKTAVSMENTKKKRKELVEEWQDVNAMQFDESGKCPYCGQELPPEKIEDARKEFNVKKSTKLEEITKSGKEVSADVIATMEKAIAQMDEKIKGCEEKISGFEIEKNELQNAEQPGPFQNTDICNSFDVKIQELKERLNRETPQKDNSIEQELAAVESDIEKNMRLLLEIENYEKKKSELEDMESKYAKTVSDCENYEFGMHLCKRFSMKKSEIMEEKVNSMFENVHFRLFKELVNGEVEEDCEPLVKCREGWIPYGKANHAAKVRAGLEVVQGLSEFFGVDMPVFIDNAESIVTDFPETKYQQIRLRAVKGVGELRCEYDC